MAKRDPHSELVFTDAELRDLAVSREGRSSVTSPGRPRRKTVRRGIRVPADVPAPAGPAAAPPAGAAPTPSSADAAPPPPPRARTKTLPLASGRKVAHLAPRTPSAEHATANGRFEQATAAPGSAARAAIPPPPPSDGVSRAAAGGGWLETVDRSERREAAEAAGDTLPLRSRQSSPPATKPLRSPEGRAPERTGAPAVAVPVAAPAAAAERRAAEHAAEEHDEAEPLSDEMLVLDDGEEESGGASAGAPAAEAAAGEEQAPPAVDEEAAPAAEAAAPEEPRPAAAAIPPPVATALSASEDDAMTGPIPRPRPDGPAGPLRKKLTEPVSWAAGLPYNGESGPPEVDGERANRVAVLLSALKVPAPTRVPLPGAPGEPPAADEAAPAAAGDGRGAGPQAEPEALARAEAAAEPLPPVKARGVAGRELDDAEVTELDEVEALDELNDMEELEEDEGGREAPHPDEELELELDAVEEGAADGPEWERPTPPPVPPPQPFDLDLGEHPVEGVLVVKESDARAAVRDAEKPSAGDDGVMTSAPPDEEDPSSLLEPVAGQPPPPVPALDAAGDGVSAGAAALPEAPPEPPPREAAAPPAPAGAEEEGARARRRQRAWFDEIFDEDYLRLLPRYSAKMIAREVDFIEESLQPAPDSEILDIGSGDGRHAIELAARGYRLTGFDRSLPLLVRAADAAQARDIKVNFVQSDFRELSYDEAFDAAYCISTTFGYFDDDTNRKMISAINTALRVGGRFLLGVVNRDFIIRDLPARRWWEGDGCVVLEEVDFNFFTSRVISKRSVVMHDGRHLEYEVSVRCYSLHELGKILHHAGFRVLEVAGNLAHRTRFFGNQSSALLMLAEKRSK